MDDMPEKRKEDEWDAGFVSDLSFPDTYAKAWQVSKKSFWGLLVVGIVFWILQLPVEFLQNQFLSIVGQPDYQFDSGAMQALALWLIAILYSTFVILPMIVSLNWVYLKAVRSRKFGVDDLFAIFQRNYWHTMGAIFLAGFFMFLGTLLFVVPGIFIFIRLSFVYFLVIDRRMKALEAIKVSWAMTKNRFWIITGLATLGTLISIAVGFIPLIGTVLNAILVTIFMTAVNAVLYHSVLFHDGIPGEEKRKNDMEYAYP